MASLCFDELSKTIKSIIGTEDAKALIDEIEARTEAKVRRNAEPFADAYNKTIDEVLAERDERMKLSQIQARLSAKKFIAAEVQINAFKRKGRGLDAFMGGVETNIEKGRFSVVNIMRRTIIDIKSAFITDLDKNGAFKFFSTRANELLIAKELIEEGSTGHDLAKVTARIIKRSQEFTRKGLVKEGVPVGEAEAYIAKLRHNTLRMKSAMGFGLKDAKLRASLFAKHKGNITEVNKEYDQIAFERWRDTILPRLDKEKTFKDTIPGEEEKFLRGAYDGLITGVHKKAYDVDPEPFQASGNIGNRLAAQRVFFFKDAESWMDYNRDYGWTTLHDAVISQMEDSGRSLGIIKMMGTSPKSFFDRLSQKVKTTGETRKEPQLKRNLRRAKLTSDFVLSNYDMVDEGLSGRMLNSFRNFTFLTKTGGIVLSSTPDLGIMASALRQHNIPATSVYNTALGNIFKGLPKGEMKELALSIGVYSDGMLGNLMSKWGSVDTFAGKFGKAMMINDHLTGINRWDNTTRWTMGYLLSKNLADIIDTPFDTLPANERRTLVISGINERVWKTIQSNKGALVEARGIKFLTPQIADDLSDAAITRDFLGKDSASKLQIEDGREQIKTALGIYFTDQTAYGKVLPTESDMAFIRQGVNAQTIPGRIWQLVTMFKSFHIASIRRTWGRFLYGNGAENLYEAVAQGKADVSGLVNYFVQTMPLGYLSYASKLMADGFAPPPLDDKTTWEQAFLRGGFSTLYGSVVSNTFNEQGGILQGLAGPAVNTFVQTAKLLQTLTSGKPSAAAATSRQAYWLIKNNIPYINTWYAKAAIDRALLKNIHEEADPGYQARAEARARQRGLTYISPP